MLRTYLPSYFHIFYMMNGAMFVIFIKLGKNASILIGILFYLYSDYDFMCLLLTE